MARQIFRVTNSLSNRGAVVPSVGLVRRTKFTAEPLREIRSVLPVSVSYETRILVRCEWRLRNHEGRCRLWSVAFGVPRFTPKANVHDGRVCKHVWNSPIERLGFPIQPGANPHGECSPTVHRQPYFHLTGSKVYVGKHRSPFNPDVLPRVENLPNPRRNQRGRICSSRACSTNELWSCVKRHHTNGRKQDSSIHFVFPPID